MNDTPDQSGAFVEIDPKKLGNEGHRILGKLDALTKWTIRFSAFHDKAIDLHERRTLKEVVNALMTDCEDTKIELAQFAQRRGAGKITPAEVKPAELMVEHVVSTPIPDEPAGNDNAA